MIFAAQAGPAIMNARAHRVEQRMRARYETLMEVTPVGVLLFDMFQSEIPLANPEALRPLTLLGLSNFCMTTLFEKLQLKFPDGRQVTIDSFSSHEALRNIKVEFALAEGYTLQMLINVTPLRCDQGQVHSLMVAIQDLSPFVELDRLRLEFLDMVSHELRVPLASIKGSTAALLNAKYRPDRTEVHQFVRRRRGPTRRRAPFPVLPAPGAPNSRQAAGRVPAATVNR